MVNDKTTQKQPTNVSETRFRRIFRIWLLYKNFSVIFEICINIFFRKKTQTEFRKFISNLLVSGVYVYLQDIQ